LLIIPNNIQFKLKIIIIVKILQKEVKGSLRTMTKSIIRLQMTVMRMFCKVKIAYLRGSLSSQMEDHLQE